MEGYYPDLNDTEGLIRFGPTKAEVETQFALPDLPTTVQGLVPMDAFKAFMDYAERAIGRRFVARFNLALEREIWITNEYVKDERFRSWTFPTKEQREAQADAMGKATAARFAPLLPAMRNYVLNRRHDPTSVNRLAWMADEVDTVIEGAAGLRPMPVGIAEEAAGLRRTGKWQIPKEWSELREGLRAMIADFGTTTAQPATATPTAAPAERLKWNSSTAAFAYIFRTLAAQGYFDLPRKGGKGNDPNTAAFARMLLQAFEIPAKDGNPITPEVLRVRLADGAPGRLADTKAAKFQIPPAGKLIVPDAGEME